ncbi:hypothetical protein C8J57DRAFT_1732012 [Mycena rebaudengoi]|nr:hypothetical protein C8J57DRAFT_1735433 [Mycena rebaudengoi]KAJ7219777.1 hypothetical protein C8J57DRAFT_1732012 [Mycena rebaudengoi]
MHRLYDMESAVARLNKLAVRRRIATENRNDPADRPLATLDLENLSVHETGKFRKEWRMAVPEDVDGTARELTVRLQGILINCDLVPTGHILNCTPPGKEMFLAHRVKLGGFGAPAFSQSLEKVQEIFDMFAACFPNEKMVPWREAECGSEVLTASTRLFTVRADAPNKEDTVFDEGIDITGRLAGLKGNTLLHLDDNKVAYLKVIMEDAERKIRYIPATPAMFRVGDIVEAEVYFVAVQRKNGEIVMTIRLQGLTLLDSNYSKALELSKRPARKRRGGKVVSLKRKAACLYDDEYYEEEEDGMDGEYIVSDGY